ncbi:MAG: BlaI/MecI/CopY family transcriptional regulator [Crocinitomicaceae bacterium]|nr:BlaI/MecI/CopY family transcriptional regulator [Crocinitomicaceae bacterium]
MYDLTKAEEQVMQILWELKEAFVKDVVIEFPEPKPAYNTVSTIIRILEKKKIVGYKAFGRTHMYYPLITKEEYTKHSANSLVNKYFAGSFEQMVSFFVKEKNISASELEEIINKIDKL